MQYKRIKAIVLIVLFVMAGVLYSTDRRQEFSTGIVLTTQAETYESEALTTEAVNQTSETTTAKASGKTLLVHVCGAVYQSGVYELPEGSIVKDAIELAGGVRKSGARDYLNLAQKLFDGDKIYVPYKKELTSNSKASACGVGLVTGTTVTTGSTDSKESLVNINTATKEVLTTLTGIGDARAQAILDYREEKGAFQSIEEIMQVSGIKEGAFEKIKNQITV